MSAISTKNTEYEYDKASLLEKVRHKVEAFYNAVEYPLEGPAIYASLWANQTPIVLVRNGVEVSGTPKDFETHMSAMFSHIKKRTHVIHRIYVLHPGSMDIMVDGHTDYEHNDGSKEVKKWAARQCYTLEGDEVKLVRLIMQSVTWATDQFQEFPK